MNLCCHRIGRIIFQCPVLEIDYGTAESKYHQDCINYELWAFRSPALWSSQMSCGPLTMIVAVVDFKDWGLQIIALLCHRIGKDYNTSCHRIGKEKRCLKFLKKRIGSHDLAKRWGVLSWFNMFRYVSEKILSRRVMSRGCFTLLDTPRPLKSVNHST